ncbi:MAG: hypothetical protein FWB87_04335 [Defluviitaleaceae bacterium]|nr:hypothetical protein [Defluviitaleaceae bacterium]
MPLQQGQLNRRTADALCTVITVGFLQLNQRRDAQNSAITNFLAEGDFNYENHQPIDHTALQIQMTDMNPQLGALFPRIEEQVNKREHPFIYARREGIDDIVRQIILDNRMQPLTENLERFARENRQNFPGAYIGGTLGPINNNVNLTLYAPSLLYQYAYPNYINVDDEYVNAATRTVNSFVDASESLLRIFSLLSGSAIDLNGDTINFHYTENQLNQMADQILNIVVNNEYALASVHGLITSLVEAPPYELNADRFNVELALGTKTKKVASCIPCSIFSMAQGAPPSFAHFGRGDYWNLPQNIPNEMRHNWEAFVANCYVQGMQLLSPAIRVNILDNFFFQRLDDELNAGNIGYIGDVFISSLTFPGGFIGRMSNTLNLIA